MNLSSSRLTVEVFVLSMAYLWDIFLCFYTYDYALDISKQKFWPKTRFRRGRHDTKRERPGRVGRGEQGEAHPGNRAPRVGPELEIFRRRLKTWPKTDPSGALVQPPDIPPCVYHMRLHHIALNVSVEGTLAP